MIRCKNGHTIPANRDPFVNILRDRMVCNACVAGVPPVKKETKK